MLVCMPLIWGLPREGITLRGTMVLPTFLVFLAVYFALLWKNVLWGIRFYRQGDTYRLFSCVLYIIEALLVPVRCSTRIEKETA